MYINQIDNLFDNIINNFNSFLINKKVFEKLSKDINFVKYQNEILEIVKNFIKEIDIKEIGLLTNKKERIEYIVDIIKRYCAFYIYLGIAYHYMGDRELFITNMIETSKNIKDSDFTINNFFNSDNNAKIITMYTVIKDIIQLNEYKTIERIKIILGNEPIKYSDTIILLNQLGEDFFNDYFLTKDNFHNIIKTFIFRQIYLLEEKNDIITLLNETEQEDAVYKYIDIIVSKQDKLIDFTFLQNILSLNMLKEGKAEEYYEFLENYKENSYLHILNNKKILDFLFSNRILIPITEDFLRYHKNTEKYDKDVSGEIKERDATKIKYVINKVNKVMNLYSSIYEKNQKIKLEAMQLFYKALEYKDAILYNDNEEVKIINKLELSENTNDMDYIIDLNNIRSYPFLNFKDLSKDGFKLRSSMMIQGIRYSNIKHIQPKNRKLDLRVGHQNLPLNVIGVVYNPSHRYMECSDTTMLHDITKKYKNGFDGLIDIISKNDKNDKNLYYWLFDLEKDKVKLTEYKNISSMNDTTVIENILSEVYQHYMMIQKKELYNILNKIKPDNIYSILRLIHSYQSSFRFIENINLNQLTYDTYNKFFKKMLPDLKLKSRVEEKKEIIKIPVSPKIKIKEFVINIMKELEEIDILEIKNQPICHHYLKWIGLSKISKKSDEELNQAIFDFVKQYVKTNEKGEFICKSCSELLDLKKYVYEGTYVAELDTFMTTSLAVNQKLNEIPKYMKYSRTIRNIEKNIEKICYAINLSYYIGNTSIIKLRRKTVIKDVIDLILIHTEYLKNQPKDRIAKAVETYNIHPDLTNLFFFELKDDVFLTNSLDTDYYKTLKFNNVIAYIFLILIADLNTGQIINMKEDKKCNYFIYSNIGDQIFSKLFIRISETEKITVSSIPLLSYVLFYMSCIFTNNMIWLWNSNNANQQYNIQKTIIHTMVDLINTLIEANMLKDKNFLYELIVNRLMYKIKNTYMDNNAMNTIRIESQKKIKVDNVTNKISYIARKDKIINITQTNEKFTPIVVPNKICKTSTYVLDIIPREQEDFNTDIYTNCSDGRFHEWEFTNKKLICKLCNLNYDEIKKSNDMENINRLNQVRMLYLIKLASTYCISGELHDIDLSNNICNKCKINIVEHKYSMTELNKLEKNLKNLNSIKAVKEINNIKRYFEKELKRKEKDNITLHKFNEEYNKKTNNIITNYINDFIDNLIKYLGPTIKIDNSESKLTTIHLKDTMYIIRNDYLGNEIKDKITILSSENKIQTIDSHPHFKTNVIYYLDKINNVFVFYEQQTKNYIGYSKDNKKFISYKSNAYIEVINSVKDMIVMMGLENQFYNIYHISRLYMYKDTKIDTYDIMTEIIRIRCNNLRQCIERSSSIIEKVKNVHNNKLSIYNSIEHKLVGDFQKSIKQFNTSDTNNTNMIFNNMYTITNNINIDPIEIKLPSTILSKQYIDTKYLISMNNMDCKLLFYYLENLSKLFQYNDMPAIRTSLCYMIIKLIIYNYNTYYIPLENFEIRKFDSLLLTEAPYMDESMRVVGYYQDLVNVKEIDDEVVKEMNYDMNEERTALDMDDNENEDAILDYDAMDEMLEHYTDY